MSTVAVSATTGWARSPKHTLANLGVYSVFTWKRNWLRLVIWAVVTVGMIGFVADYYLGIFGHDKTAMQGFSDIAAQPPMNWLIGTVSDAAALTLGGAIWSKYWMFGGLMLMIGMLYLTTRNLRGDEDAGRAELMRAYPLGLHSRLAATIWINVVGSAIIGLLCGPVVAPIIAGSDWGGGATGAYAFGLSIAGLAILGVGIGALTNQLAPTNGGANGIGIGVIAVFYVIRLMGDMNNSSTLVWISPIGWGQKVDPWGANRLWPILLQVALAAVCIVIAWVLERRRDLGAGLFAARTGSAHATKFTTTSVGLSLRTQRASIIAWFVGVVIMGDLLGSVVQKMHDLLSNSTFGGADVQSGLVEGVIALMSGIVALCITAFGIQSISTVRANEEMGLAEAQLAGPLSRMGWALRRLAVAFALTVLMLLVAGYMMGYAYQAAANADQTLTMAVFIKAVLVYLPAIILLMSVFVLGFGWWPRQSVMVAWIVFGLMFVFMIVGVATKIPQKVLNLMPFQALPAIPLDPMRWTPVLVELGIAIVLMVVGLIGFRRRNVPVL
ncbi:MAG: hypothetical protein FWD63_05825 [Propionibacteriaceae bacterium]|nr:hypothetical protein [Propionibacteriaceae bacterium]